MYKTILVPIDVTDSETSRKTLEIARAIGGAEARIVLFHVLPEIPAFVSSELPEGTLAKNLRSGLEALKAFGKDFGAEAEVRYGHAPMAILEFADEIGADLIVVGSHRPGFQDYFLGSTASRVVRHAQCAVLVDR